MTETETQFTRIEIPREGLPDLIDSPRGLNRAAELLANGTGPVALDAERASGFKYSQRAYLVQLRRQNSGTFLIDPTEFENLALIQEAISGTDWILHAASQDLVCLAEVGLRPTKELFDTELAGRLLGLPKVGLGTLVETQLGFSLAKEHSAADWSVRPLPDEWLAYAALDVEFLIELWDLLQNQLSEQNKFIWAQQEFDHVKINTIPTVRTDPWRKLSGIHKIKDRRQMAIARSLWRARDDVAKNLDISSGRILNDSHIIAISEQPDWSKVLELPFIKLRMVQRNLKTWQHAFQSGLDLNPDELPELKVKSDSPPHPRSWQTRHPELFAKLEKIRTDLAKLAEDLALPVENLISPETIRRAVWQKPTDLESLHKIFAENKARKWQRELVSQIVVEALEIN